MTPSTPGRYAHELWVRGPFWDVLWLQSALWLAPMALLLAHGYADPTESPLDALCFALTALFWIGHRIGSTWLAYDWLDRAVYRLSKPDVRIAARGLLEGADRRRL